MLAIAASLSSCLITRTEEMRVPSPLTVPRIQDVQNITSPRIGALTRIDEDERETTQEFVVPVDDDGVNDTMQFQFFVNEGRDCIIDGGVSCEPTNRLGEVPPNGDVRRYIRRTIKDLVVGCNRVDLYVSSRIPQSGTFRTPERAGDLAFQSWWIFVRSRTPSTADGGVSNPVENCPFQVQP